MADARFPALTRRQERVLFAACRAYVANGRPVSSRTLVEAYGLEWSTATVRTELAGLERVGLLYQPYSSAGRVPTAAGLQLYVNGLDLPEGPEPGLARAVDRGLAEVSADPAQRLKTAVWLLSEALDCVAVSLVGRMPTEPIRGIELVRVVDSRVLVVVTRADGSSQLVPVTLDSLGGIPSDDVLARTEERLRQLCVGRTLLEAREVLLPMWRDQKHHLDRMLENAVRVGIVLCTAAALDPLWVQIAGQPNLARSLGPANNETLRHMLALFEDVHRLAEVLFQLLPDGTESRGPKAGVWVDAGRVLTDAAAASGLSRADQPPMSNISGLTMVGCRLPMFDPIASRSSLGHTGVIALLGPDRMDFAVVIPLVEYAARALAAPPTMS